MTKKNKLFEHKVKPFDLQIFADLNPVNGEQMVFYYRLLKNEKIKAATFIGMQTEGSESLSRDSDSTQTKSGAIPTKGTLEVELSFTALVAKDGEAEKELKGALMEGEDVEMWLVNLGRKGIDEDANKFDATYYQGILSEFERSADSEDFATYSTTFKGKGKPKDGYLTVASEEAEALEYAFRDLAKVEEAPR